MSHINNLQVICQINEFIQLIYILFLDFFKNFLLNITFFLKIIWLFVNYTGGSRINRDPAAVADTTSGNVRTIWCEDAYLIAYDPSWIFTDLYSS